MKQIHTTTVFLSKSSTYIGTNVKIGKNCIIYPSVVIEDNVLIGDNVTIQSGTLIKSNVYIENNVFVGSVSLIRNNVWIKENAIIGFNCEIKSTVIGKKTVIAHKSYVGNAIIEDNVKIGCGLVIANFNGGKINWTKIKENTNIGINCSLIAPITIGKNCEIAACSILRKNLEDNMFFKTEYSEKVVENKKLNILK